MLDQMIHQAATIENGEQLAQLHRVAHHLPARRRRLARVRVTLARKPARPAVAPVPRPGVVPA